MAGMRVTGQLGGGFAPFGDADGDLVLPGRYVVEVDEPSVGHTLELQVVIDDGRPVCESLTVRRRPGGPAVSAETIRKVTLGRYLRASAAVAAMRARANSDGSMTLEPIEPTDDAAALVDADRRAAGRGRRRAITDDHLAEVARVYEAELGRVRDSGQAGPTAAVAKQWKVAAPTASRWVREARRRGHLPPYRRGEQ